MTLSYRQELSRLAQRIKGMRRRQLVEYATIADTSPYEKYGFVIAKLIDDTPVNVRTWTNLTLEPGSEIMIVRIGEQDWNWWALVAVNGSTTSTDDGGIPYTPPKTDPTTTSPHALGGSSHTGLLPWARIDLSDGKVALDADVQGILPRDRQESQIYKLTVTQEITVDAETTATGDFSGANNALVREITLTGGLSATLRMFDATGGNELYATNSGVTTPYVDKAFPFFHEDAHRDQRCYYELTNPEASPAAYTLTLVLMIMGS